MGPLATRAAVSSALIAVLVALPTAAATTVAPVVMHAPYAGTTTTTSRWNYSGGCGTSDLTTPPRFSPTSGVLSTSVVTTARTCFRSPLGAYQYSYGSAYSATQLILPFNVSSGGIHDLAENWTINLAAKGGLTVGGCPSKNITWNPQPWTSSYGYCMSNREFQFSLQSQILDTSDPNWDTRQNSTQSFVSLDYMSSWQNYTYCSNPPSWPAPTCTNTTGAWFGNSTPSYNVAGPSRLTWNGVAHLVLWTNASNMSSKDHFEVVTILKVYADSYTMVYNLRGFWSARVGAYIDLASGGHGARMTAVTVS